MVKFGNRLTSAIALVLTVASLAGCASKPIQVSEGVTSGVVTEEESGSDDSEGDLWNIPEIELSPSPEAGVPRISEMGIVWKENKRDVWAKTPVNVRWGPSVDFTVVTTLQRGEKVQLLANGGNGWSRIIWGATELYINSKYITETEIKGPIIKNSYPMSYIDGEDKITIYKEWFENAYCYAAHLEFKNYDRLKTTCSNGKYGGGYETTRHAAKRVDAIFAVNGCYSAPKLNYIVVRDNKVWNRGNSNLWTPAVYSQTTGILYNAWETNGDKRVAGKNVNQLVKDGLLSDTFCFGPPMLMWGEIQSGGGNSRAQRTFIGTNGEPGDIWVVVSDGRRNDGKSSGLTYNQCARYLVSKGCTFGVPLDGGGSTTMYFNGKVLNAASGRERAVVDHLYFK